MSRVVPESWMPDCQMERIVAHWTAGAHHASTIDREHYHVLVEGDGHLVRGDHSIADNVSTHDDDYAAHTHNLNTGSIGISVCCMQGAIQSPFHAGSFPMTAAQYGVLAAVAADLCDRYQIPVTPETVLGHGEVQSILGVEQRGKWDPMVLPFDLEKSIREVGDAFRQRVATLLQDSAPDAQLPPVTVFLDDQQVSDEGILKDGASWSPLRPLADALGWTILQIDEHSTRVQTPSGQREMQAAIRGDRGFVQIRDLCEKMHFPPPTFDGATRFVRIQTA